MEQSEVMERVVKILTPWVKDEGALANVGMETNILEDLKVNSARLVDVVIAFEDDFDIEIADEDGRKERSVIGSSPLVDPCGDLVELTRTQGTLIEAVRKVGGEDIPGTDGRVDLCPQNGSVPRHVSDIEPPPVRLDDRPA